MSRPTSVEQRVRIAVTLLNAQQMGREVTRPQLYEHLHDLDPGEIDDAIARLVSEGVVHVQARGVVPRPPASRQPHLWPGAQSGRTLRGTL